MNWEIVFDLIKPFCYHWCLDTDCILLKRFYPIYKYLTLQAYTKAHIVNRFQNICFYTLYLSLSRIYLTIICKVWRWITCYHYLQCHVQTNETQMCKSTSQYIQNNSSLATLVPNTRKALTKMAMFNGIPISNTTMLTSEPPKYCLFN